MARRYRSYGSRKPVQKLFHIARSTIAQGAGGTAFSPIALFNPEKKVTIQKIKIDVTVWRPFATQMALYLHSIHTTLATDLLADDPWTAADMQKYDQYLWAYDTFATSVENSVASITLTPRTKRVINEDEEIVISLGVTDQSVNAAQTYYIVAYEVFYTEA
jgi:hypothetical protein